jgi:hypothetical protein
VAEATLIAAACIACLAGMGWLALAMDVHWEQVGENALAPAGVRRLRVLGVLGLAAGLALSLAADHVSMAALLWIMELAAAALAVGMTLAWRPRWLRVLAWAA